MSKKKLEGIDCYALLEVAPNATVSEIRTAYRKKALKCHPDKNPDNPKAAELFLELTDALEILLDPSSRAAYDRLLKGKEAAKSRHRKLDERRRKYKEDLEARERAYFDGKAKHKFDKYKVLEQIARLREEGTELLREEIRLLQEEINKQIRGFPYGTESGKEFKIKVEWDVPENDDNNGVYNEQTIRRLFKKYGTIAAIAILPNCKGQAIVEFEGRQAAESAMRIEKGLYYSPLRLKWVNENARKKQSVTANQSETTKQLETTNQSEATNQSETTNQSEATNQSETTNQSEATNQSLVTERDYESLVLRQMRQAEERKRLIEKLMAEDED